MEISVVAEEPYEPRRLSLSTVVNRQNKSWLEVAAGILEMVSRMESIGRGSELRSAAAVGSAKYCRRMMEVILVDRKFSMAHARGKVATGFSVDSGEYLKIALALNSRF